MPYCIKLKYSYNVIVFTAGLALFSPSVMASPTVTDFQTISPLPADSPDEATVPSFLNDQGWGENLRRLDAEGAGESPFAESLKRINAGKYDEAITLAKKALVNQPDSAPGHEVLGTALVLSGKTKEGLEELEKAVQLNPNQSTAITKIGDVLLSQKNQTKAKELFLKATTINPRNRHAHQRLGVIFEQEGLLPQAIEHYEKGIQDTPPEYVGVKVNLAALYNRSRQHQKSIALLSGLINAKSDSAIAQITLGWAYLRTGKPDEALLLFKAAAEREPGQAFSHLAWPYRLWENSMTPLRHWKRQKSLKIRQLPFFFIRGNLWPS